VAVSNDQQLVNSCIEQASRLRTLKASNCKESYVVEALKTRPQHFYNCLTSGAGAYACSKEVVLFETHYLYRVDFYFWESCWLVDSLTSGLIYSKRVDISKCGTTKKYGAIVNGPRRLVSKENVSSGQWKKLEAYWEGTRTK
jgi:hypothetical protein